MMIAACLGGLLVVGCSKYPPRPANQQLSAIPAGHYVAFAASEPRLIATDQRYWAIDLPQGGRTQFAVVDRCDVGCVGLRLPVRTVGNSLFIAFPKIDYEAAHDLKITATPDGLRLTHATPDGLWVGELVDIGTPPPIPPPEK